MPFLFLLSLTSMANRSDAFIDETIQKIKNELVIPATYFNDKAIIEIRISFKLNKEGKAEEIIVNSENEKIKNYVIENISKIKFDEKGKTLNLLVKFKLQ